MCRFALAFVLLAASVPASVGQEAGSQRLPRLSLVLPSGFASETVQINYFMGGSFGGYGGYVRAGKNRTTYEIDASVDGKPATNIKLIAYLPGCKIATLNIPLLGATQERRLPCKPLGRISLRGQIFPVFITQEQPTEVEVAYLAMWDHQFFGIYDGMVTTIRLGTVVPDANGQFEVKLPNLHKQMNLGEGEFQFILRHPTSGNILAFLKPTVAGASSDSLKVDSSYPSVVLFMAERQ